MRRRAERRPSPAPGAACRGCTAGCAGSGQKWSRRDRSHRMPGPEKKAGSGRSTECDECITPSHTAARFSDGTKKRRSIAKRAALCSPAWER
nr:MAG TPA: hypothetical protein [Caudoviricetes sp.]